MRSHQIFKHQRSVIYLLFTILVSVSFAQPPMQEKSSAVVNQTPRMQTGRVCEEQALMAYPVLARQLGVEGYLEMEFTLGDDGIPKDIKILSRRLNKYRVIGSDGNTQFVITIFDHDAIEFIKSFRCATHNSNGKISGTQVRVPLSFSLTEPVKK
jgi:outer membrane biosynthesis protein TonB